MPQRQKNTHSMTYCISLLIITIETFTKHKKDEKHPAHN